MKIKRRNPLALHPLMRKGGAHRRSKTGERRKAKNELAREAANWKHA